MSDQEKIMEVNETSSVHIPVKVRESSASRRFMLPPQHRRPPRPDPVQLEDDERLWAALAHASALLTITVGIATGGLGALLMVFVPMIIFLAYREKSEYVAHHALQAFVAQVVGFVGFMVLSTAALILWVILLLISALLILLIVGIILLPLVLLAGLLVLPALLLLPLVTLVYNVIAAVQAWNGHNYSYPWVGDWVDDQLYGRIEHSL